MFYKITDGLYQTGISRGPFTDLSKIDIVIDATYEGVLLPSHINYVAIPFNDSTEGVPEDRFWLLRALCQTLKHKSILTVCSMGENRSGLLSALILYYRGHTMPEAIQMIRDAVPPVSEVPHVLWNPAFEKQLLELEMNSLQLKPDKFSHKVCGT